MSLRWTGNYGLEFFPQFSLGPLVLIYAKFSTDPYSTILDGSAHPTLKAVLWYGPCYSHDDKDSFHVARSIIDWYGDNGLNRLNWPAQSPDLNTIKNLRVLNCIIELNRTTTVLNQWKTCLLQAKWIKKYASIHTRTCESLHLSVAAVIASHWNYANNKCQINVVLLFDRRCPKTH